jgi:hypothetical protein
MKSDSVWVSTVDMDSSLVQLMSTDRNNALWAAIREAKWPAAEDLPMKAWADSPQETFKDLPLLFMGGGGNSFTHEIAAPLLRFDLGRTFVLPIRIFLADRKTEVHADRGYHTMPRFEVFKALAPEESPALRAGSTRTPPSHWGLPWKPKDGDVAVHALALDGPAIWHDPQLFNGFFFRGDVVAAMEEAGVARHWRLIRCRVIRLH